MINTDLCYVCVCGYQEIEREMDRVHLKGQGGYESNSYSYDEVSKHIHILCIWNAIRLKCVCVYVCMYVCRRT